MNHTLSPFPADTQSQHDAVAQAPSRTPQSRRVRSATRTDNYVARLAVADSVREDAYRVRYRSYVAGGHIEPNASGLFKDVYDDMPNASTIVIYDRDVPIASVRTCTLARG